MNGLHDNIDEKSFDGTEMAVDKKFSSANTKEKFFH